MGDESKSKYLEAEKWSLLVPLLALALGKRKMFYVKDLRRVNFGFHAQETFPSQMCQGLESHDVWQLDRSLIPKDPISNL